MSLNPDDLKALAEIHELLVPLLADFGDIYVDGSLTVLNKNDYEVGRFVADDGFWRLEIT